MREKPVPVDNFPSAPGAPSALRYGKPAFDGLSARRQAVYPRRSALSRFDGSLRAGGIRSPPPPLRAGRRAARHAQSVNLLTGRRKNSFRGDGTSRVYALDATGLDDSTVTATVNGAPASDFTVDGAAGTVTFATAPPTPGGGDDNVVVAFSKTAAGNRSRIEGCTQTCAFDGRVFFTGNTDYANVLWHSELDNPAYIPDVNYYQDGDETAPIASIVVQDGSLVYIAENTSQHGAALYSHAPALDYELGRVYPVSESVISVWQRIPRRGDLLSRRPGLPFSVRPRGDILPERDGRTADSVPPQHRGGQRAARGGPGLRHA